MNIDIDKLLDVYGLSQDNWGDLPKIFEESIESAFIFENKTYMIKGDEYVRYSNNSYDKIDSIYPQVITDRWGEYADYLLTDIKLITSYNKLDEQFIGENYTLTDLLHTEKYHINKPYEVLADIFDWDEEDIKWLKRKNTFLTLP